MQEIATAHRGMIILEDEAEAQARTIISLMKPTRLLDNQEGMLRVAREQLAMKVNGIAVRAFRHGKQAAYDILKASGVTGVPRVKEPNDAERDMLNQRFAAWTNQLRASNAAFALRLSGWVQGMRAAGVSGAEINKTFALQWNSRSNTGGFDGRQTSQWQREFVSAASNLVKQAEMSGQASGFTGVGEI